MLQVYLDPSTVNSRKVLAGLDLLGTQYNVNHVDYFSGAHKGADYLKINPSATVPAAVDGDLAITDSNAILAYAADAAGGSAYPQDPKKRAAINSWLLWEASALLAEDAGRGRQGSAAQRGGRRVEARQV